MRLAACLLPNRGLKGTCDSTTISHHIIKILMRNVTANYNIATALERINLSISIDDIENLMIKMKRRVVWVM